jgi:hypothetical protein
MSDLLTSIILITIILCLSILPCCIIFCTDIYLCCLQTNNEIPNNYHLHNENLT